MILLLNISPQMCLLYNFHIVYTIKNYMPEKKFDCYYIFSYSIALVISIKKEKKQHKYFVFIILSNATFYRIISIIAM